MLLSVLCCGTNTVARDSALTRIGEKSRCQDRPKEPEWAPGSSYGRLLCLRDKSRPTGFTRHSAVLASKC